MADYTILLVDDDTLIHTALRGIVEAMGIRFMAISDGREVLPVLNAHPEISLILMDITLDNGLNGTELARDILAEREIPVLFLTASDDRETMERVGEITHFGVVLKNSSRFVITEAIKQAYRLYEYHRNQLEREYLYRALVESIQDIVLIHDPEGIITFANPRASTVMGIDSAAVIGTHINGVFGEDYFAHSQAMISRHGVESDRTFEIDRDYTPSPGSTIRLDIRSSALIVHSRYAGELLIIRDVTRIDEGHSRVEQLNRQLLSIREVYNALARSTEAPNFIQEACDILVRTGAYRSAWILLNPLEENGPYHAGAAGRLSTGTELLSLVEERRPECIRELLQCEDDFVAFREMGTVFPDCAVSALFDNEAGMIATLRHGDHSFGTFFVAIERSLHGDGDAAQIFQELVNDISVAIHTVWQKLRALRAEREAEIQRQRLETFFQHSPLAIVTLDLHGRIISCNPFFRKWLGYGPDELREIALYDTLVQVPPALRRFLASAATGGILAQQISLSFSRKNGKSVMGEGTIVRIPADRPEDCTIMAVIGDVTPRKVAELRLEKTIADLRRSEARYRSLFEDSTTMVFVTREDGTILELNDAGAKLLGVESPRELIGTNALEFYMDPADRDYFVNEMKSFGQVKSLEVVMKTRSGETVFGSESASIFHDNASGEEQQLFHGVIHDITQRIKSVQEHMQQTLELSRANEELRRAQEELIKKEKLASIGQLSAGVAHEINNPLGFVRSNLSALRRYIDKYLPFLQQYRDGYHSEEAGFSEGLASTWKSQRIEATLDDIRELFEETEDGIKRIIAIVTNLKDFSRAGSNEEMDDYDINAGVQSSLIIARNEYKYVAEVEVAASEVPSLSCNANEINQVLLTLVINSAQALKGAERTDGLISITTWADDDTVFCKIDDNGPGVPEELRRKIFEPFFTTKKAGEGTGLGLSIAYDIVVNRHHGTMTLGTSPTGGASFTLGIPRKAPVKESER